MIEFISRIIIDVVVINTINLTVEIIKLPCKLIS